MISWSWGIRSEGRDGEEAAHQGPDVHQEGGVGRGQAQGGADALQALALLLLLACFHRVRRPVCTAGGSVFDIMNIIPYIGKYRKHPVTGAPLKQEDIVPFIFYKNSDVMQVLIPEAVAGWS